MMPQFKVRKRRALTLDEEHLVQKSPIDPEKGLGLLITPAVGGVNLIDWAARNIETIEKELLEYGALLFRRFEPDGTEDFERFIRTVSGNPMEYVYRSTPRSRIHGNIYTTTEYPPHETIPMHNENSYQSSWPLKLFLFCAEPPGEGGETPLSDSRRVYRRIDPEARAEFVRKGVMYVRNYGELLDIPWQTVFQTEDRSEVEAYCRKAGICFEWKGEHGLKTRQVRPACTTHPVTGEMLWFNQAHLFHVSSLRREIRDNLLEAFGEEDLPRNAYYGDGTPIDDGTLEVVRQAYRKETVKAPWKLGDVAIVDNMMLAHAREPYRGPRKILIGMTDPYSDD